MSCTALDFEGIDDGVANLRVAKSSDSQSTFALRSSQDATGWTGTFMVRATENAVSALLTVTEAATVNGSVIVYSDEAILLRLKAADLATLPLNADDANTPWEGVYEWVNTDTADLTTRFLAGTIIVERGVVR